MKAKKEFLRKVNQFVNDQRLDPNKRGLFTLIFAMLNSDSEVEKEFFKSIITAQYITKQGIRLVEDKSITPGAPASNIENEAKNNIDDMLSRLMGGSEYVSDI